jgi:hypothetical protein
MQPAITSGVGRRVYVFTGTSNQYIAMSGAFAFVSVVPEYYFINNSTGNLYIEDTVGNPIATVPPGGDATVTGTAGSIGGYEQWHASVGSSSLGLGQSVGQTYTNVTNSRAFYVTYTNTTGRPIFVEIVINGGAIGAAVTATLVVNGVAGPYVTPAIDRQDPVPISAVIPVGGTYVLQYNVAQYISIGSWVELR